MAMGGINSDNIDPSSSGTKATYYGPGIARRMSGAFKLSSSAHQGSESRTKFPPSTEHSGIEGTYIKTSSSPCEENSAGPPASREYSQVEQIRDTTAAAKQTKNGTISDAVIMSTTVTAFSVVPNLFVISRSASSRPTLPALCKLAITSSFFRTPYYWFVLLGLNENPALALFGMTCGLKPGETLATRAAAIPGFTFASFRRSIKPYSFSHVAKDLMSGTVPMALRETGFLYALHAVEPTEKFLRDTAHCGEYSQQYAALSVGFFAGFWTQPFNWLKISKEIDGSSYIEMLKRNHFSLLDGAGYRGIFVACAILGGQTALNLIEHRKSEGQEPNDY